MQARNVIELLVSNYIIKRTSVWRPLLLYALSCTPVMLHAQKNVKPVSPLVVTKGKISYNADSLGNRIPDFSYCGYAASEEAIPDVAIKIVVPVSKGDATHRIQSAIDYVAALPADEKGFRGAVLLQKGNYRVDGQLKMLSSGIVLRGSGKETIVTGAGKDRETLIMVAGKNDKSIGEKIRITDAYVPVNATSFAVSDASLFAAGDTIIIHRPSTLAWIKTLGTEHFGGGITSLGWKPGERDLFFERKIVAISNKSIQIDVPITTALDTAYGGATIAKLNWPGRIQKCGIENLTLVSEYDSNNPKDEAHRWMAITMENVIDGWVRNVSFRHFAGSAVSVLESARRVTVEDCKSLVPVSEIGGQRRISFFTSGQQTLFQRCYAENGYHDFAVGYCAPGPNAFVQCHSSRPYQFSGTIDSWASGVLFDIVNVDGNAIRFGNRGQDGNGAGWTAANSVLWQCTAARIDCERPPTANNYSFGSWAQFEGYGYWESSNEQVQPRSLYYAQLSERLGPSVMKRAFILPLETEASSSPSVDVAMALTKKALTPAPTLYNWIDTVTKQYAISINPKGIKTIDDLGIKSIPAQTRNSRLQVQNSWLVNGNKVVTGRRQDVQWWSGGILPNDLLNAKPHITRFVPGRTGKGLTDDLDSVTNAMQRMNIITMEHNYGLWYDRRRDDHERIRRMDGEVWAPFYELPFARSGKDTAWDGLSKYDLTKYNHWYWSRLKKFADLADEKGLVLVHQNYFQHNIIEAGAHYADFPWRTANNINTTGFPEPVPYAGDKRIFMAEQFYDISNATRRKLHTSYIRMCLDNFKDNSSVIQLTSAEYTGSLHFVQFWIDVARQWEKEKGKNALIGLSTTKDVQDALLADGVRAAAVDIIDIRYWHYQEDGTLYAPKGGQNLAPRQHARLLKPKRSSFEQVYRAVSEYRKKFPGKAVMYSADGYDQLGWAVFMAGGSMAVLPQMDSLFLKEAAVMLPIYDPATNGLWRLKGLSGEILYTEHKTIKTNLDTGKEFDIRYIHPKTGKIIKEEKKQGGKDIQLDVENGSTVIWIKETRRL